jgi:hypothetical protein
MVLSVALALIVAYFSVRDLWREAEDCGRAGGTMVKSGRSLACHLPATK